MAGRSSTAIIFGNLVSSLIRENPDVAANKKNVLQELAGQFGFGKKPTSSTIDEPLLNHITGHVIKTYVDGLELNIDLRRDASDGTLFERNKLDTLAAQADKLPQTAKAYRDAILAKEKPIRDALAQQLEDEKRTIDKLRQLVDERQQLVAKPTENIRSKLDAIDQKARAIRKEFETIFGKGQTLVTQVSILEETYLNVASSEAKVQYKAMVRPETSVATLKNA